jgi:hypothetical protein
MTRSADRLTSFESFAGRRTGTISAALTKYAEYFEDAAKEAMATYEAIKDEAPEQDNPDATTINIRPHPRGFYHSAKMYAEQAAQARQVLAEWDELTEGDEDDSQEV